MSDADLAKLTDPVFLLALKDDADKIRLDQLETLIQPQDEHRHLFVVSESIAKPGRPQGRRAVIAFTGFNGGVSLRGNAMLSVVFNSEEFPVDPISGTAQSRLPFIEAWGWDAQNGVFNYYRLDRHPSETRPTWKFQGSSLGADQLDAGARRGTCFQCHINGAPVMKELLIPWNNWHSRDDPIPYLDRLQPPSVRWPVATDERFRSSNGNGGLRGAGFLETMIISALSNFARARVESHLGASGTVSDTREFVDAKRVLRHLFETTEFNIISSNVKSNMHPLAGQPLSKPGRDLTIPPSFFLNSALIGGGGLSGLTGLGVSEAIGFPGADAARLTPDEYASLVANKAVKIGGVLGDANFAWLVPEASQVDNRMADELIRLGVVPGQYAAAVMSIDLRNPILSPARQRLMRFVPDSFDIPSSITPPDVMSVEFFTNHDLTKRTIEALEATSPMPGSVEEDFLHLLQMKDGAPLSVLKSRIRDYAGELRARLQSRDSAIREAELARLFDHAVDRRKQVISHETLGSLDETNGVLLFPLP